MEIKESEREKKVQKRLTTFKQFSKEMVANSPSAYRYTNSLVRARPYTPYTKEEALRIIQDGNPDELRELSFSFFYTSGFYRRMTLYYATLLTYSFLVIPKNFAASFPLTPCPCNIVPPVAPAFFAAFIASAE